MWVFRRLCATADGTGGRKVVAGHGKSFERTGYRTLSCEERRPNEEGERPGESTRKRCEKLGMNDGGRGLSGNPRLEKPRIMSSSSVSILRLVG